VSKPRSPVAPDRRDRIAAELPVEPGSPAIEHVMTGVNPQGVQVTSFKQPWAPWYVIPADHKRAMQAMVARIPVDTIDHLGLQSPTVSDEDREANAEARARLEAESE
jgi:hypothetical protein